MASADPVRLMVTGSRTPARWLCEPGAFALRMQRLLCEELDMAPDWLPAQLIVGDARGVDALAEAWARDRGVPVRRMRPAWQTAGKAAGVLRNVEMVAAATWVVAFWDMRSPGTRSAIRAATAGDKLRAIVSVAPRDTGPDDAAHTIVALLAAEPSSPR